MSRALRIVCMSDTHGFHRDIAVPDGDLLLHAGDMTPRGRRDEVQDFGEWFAGLPHARKILVAGNHDFLFQDEPDTARKLVRHGSVTYLEDSGTQHAGLRIWGSPWQPWFHDWAFNLQRGEPLREIWSRIPHETDILVTHTPPFGTLDTVHRGGHSVGCEALAERLAALEPRLHVFGHIHEAYGVVGTGIGGGAAPGERLSVNASCCTLAYQPTQAPVVIDWDPGAGPLRVL